MGKLSIIFVLVMLVSGYCSSSDCVRVDAQNLCQKILEENSCKFYNCTRHCFEEYGSVKARCIPNPSKHWLHACACYVPC